MPPGRHISRMLQLEQVTSYFFGEAVADLMAVTAYMATLPFSMTRGALRDDVAHPDEFPALVEKSLGAQPLGELPVRIGRMIGEEIHVDPGRLVAHRTQHVETGAVGELDVEDHELELLRE